jgi:hypothetical protein
MSRVQLNYIDGQLTDFTIEQPLKVTVTDCRSGGVCLPFVTVTMSDRQVRVTGYMPPAVAQELYIKLGKLFNTKETEE